MSINAILLLNLYVLFGALKMNFKIIVSACFIFLLGFTFAVAKDWNTPVDIGSSIWRGAISAAEDFDGDGDIDIIAFGEKDNLSNNFAGRLYRNNGIGDFTEESLNGLDIETNGRKILYMEAHDFNGDGLKDIIYRFTDFNVWIYTVAVYINNGDGASWTEKLLEQQYKGAFAVSDIDNDGDSDFIFSDSYGKKQLFKFVNDGNANFTITGFEVIGDDIDPNTGSSVIPRNSDLASFDVNGDNHPDLISIYYNTMPHDVGVMQVFTNDGAGNFTESLKQIDDENTNSAFNVGDYAMIMPVELSGDNNTDFIMATNGSSWSYISNGLGGFTVQSNNVFPWTAGIRGKYQFVDLNDDAQDDILILNNSYSTTDAALIKGINNGNNTYTFSVVDFNNPLKGQPAIGKYLNPKNNDFTVADFDGDGHIDLNMFVSATASTFATYGGLFKTSCYPASNITNTIKISDTEYQFTASVDNLNCNPITERGFVWSTNANPTLEDNHGSASLGSGNGEFTHNITNLQIGPGYYVRAYAKNLQGTSYSNSVNFGVIPTLPEWGLIILGIGIMIGGGWFMFKRVF